MWDAILLSLFFRELKKELSVEMLDKLVENFYFISAKEVKRECVCFHLYLLFRHRLGNDLNPVGINFAYSTRMKGDDVYFKRPKSPHAKTRYFWIGERFH